MALTENKQVDKIEVVGNGIIQVREVTTILKDGEFYARTFHRWSFAPESDISAMPANVQAIAQAAWTPEVIAAYKAQLEASRLGVSA
jgi:hypothetical protein